MKRYLVILIILSIMVSFPVMVNADENKQQVIKLTLEQAYKLLETNNLELKLMDKRIEIEKIQYNKAIEEALDIKEKMGSSGNANLQSKRIELLNPKQAKLRLDALINERTDKLESLKLSIKQQYIDILSLQKDITYMYQTIQVMDQKLIEMETRIKLGQAKELDYKSLYSQKLSLQNQINSLNMQIENYKINFKKLMGIEMSQPIELEDITLPYQTIDKQNISKCIIDSIDSNFSVYRIKKELEIKQLEIDLMREYTNYENLRSYDKLLIELKEIEAELNAERANVEASLWIDYYELLLLEDNIKLEQVNLEIEKINYDTTAAKYKLGIVNSTTDLNASITYNRQKNNYQRAMYSYIIAIECFKEKLD